MFYTMLEIDFLFVVDVLRNTGGPDITCQKNSGSLEGSNKSKKPLFVRSKIYIYIYIYIRMKKNTIKIRNSQNNYGKLYVFNLL
jgi:hypothetical protein